MIAELLGGVGTDHLLRHTGSVQIARSLQIAVAWSVPIAVLVPAIFVHDLAVGLAAFTLTLFFMGLAGAAVCREIKWHCKYTRQNGIHVSPIFMVDGLI